MAKVLPFKAVRPTRDKVSLVASRSYQSYTQAELEARLDYNPFSFLHVVNPGYRYHKTISGKERYQLVKNRYLEFKEDSVFIQDNKPSYYIYKIVNREGNSFSGIIAGTSAEDYELDVIKKHEDTIEFREQIFKDYLKTVGFNAEPVLLTYPDNPIIDSIILETQKERAEFEFTTTYRDTHYLWILNNEKTIDIVKRAFEAIDTIYIADGHHRSASSYLLSKELKSQNKEYKDFRIKDIKLKEEEVEEGEGIGYLTPNAFGKKKKNIYTSQYGYKLVPKKVKGSGLEVKQLFEKTDRNEFQAKRIAAFDEVEERFNNISKLISNAKNKTAQYYSENPGSYEVVYSTDYIFELLEEIEAKLTNNPE